MRCDMSELSLVWHSYTVLVIWLLFCLEVKVKFGILSTLGLRLGVIYVQQS
uniref:Uncharacterized protein n=1 Tax=Tetraselmis sp. GSL018 TaxID=582737 RepID=A0A061RAK3_9CHLO